MIRGIYSATLSLIKDDLTLDVDETIGHAVNSIRSGLAGTIFFGSTGMSQLISLNEKKELISKIAHNKFKQQFYLGTGCNSLNENLDLIGYGMEFGFSTYLIMPSAYYPNVSDDGVFNFYSIINNRFPKIKIILYNFEKLSKYLFSIDSVNRLVKAFPKNIIGVKDSSYNLFEKLKIENLLVFPGSEAKLLKGLEIGCAGCISAVTNLTHSLAKKVFDDFEKKVPQTMNEKLISVRETFDNYNLIPAVHSFASTSSEKYENLLPPLTALSKEKQKELLGKLKRLDFTPNKDGTT